MSLKANNFQRLLFLTSKTSKVEQGDPLSPLLFSLAVHASLRHANESLREGEYLFAFLDDVYTVTPKNRATEVARMVASRIHEHAGVEPKLGKF